jgi:flavin reductase (DIM6/NTAB) family NADH-FMN oxidoreductase RutF
MSIDAQLYRQVLGHFPTGVTVVTGLDGDEPVGFTIGSFTSVSLDPPLVGFLPMVDSDRWNRIRRTDAFCVNVLAADQAALCWNFSKSSITDPFEGVDWKSAPATGSPAIEGAIAWIDCEIHDVVEAGDHHFVMGLVRDLAHTPAEHEPAPLLFYRGKLGGFIQH